MVASPTTQLMGLSDVHRIEPKLISPHAREAERIAAEICQAAQMQTPKFHDYNTMSAYLYPKASLERLVAIILVTNFLYYVDDVYDRHKRLDPNEDAELYMRMAFEKCIQIMMCGKMPTEDVDNPLYQGSLAIYKYMMPLTNESWIRSFIGVMIEHLKSSTYTLEEILAQEGGDPLEQYLALRELDGGMRPTMRMIEFANNSYLSDELREHPYIRQVEAATSSIGALMNDIFSYEKEVIRYGSRFNLVALFQDYYDMSFEYAVHKAVEVVNKHTGNFLALQQSMPLWMDTETNVIVRGYVNGLKDQISATWFWQYDTDRYRSPASPFPELQTKGLL